MRTSDSFSRERGSPYPWLDVVEQACRHWPTPFYVAAFQPVRAAIAELEALDDIGVRVRHWLSVKTQPLKPLLVEWFRQFGFGAEVISGHELHAALASGFTASDILVNGVAKHAWLDPLPGMRVHLDSLGEISGLGARKLRRVTLGARCFLPSGHNPDDPTIGGQFGMTSSELSQAQQEVHDLGCSLEGLHVHLRSNIREVETYAAALEAALEMGRAAGIRPRYIDLGGGLPSPGESSLEFSGPASNLIDIPALTCALRDVLRSHPYVQEVWFENGRFVTSRSAVLVISVLEIKERDGCRFLLCDGGRTNHALPSDWEEHAIEIIPKRTGEFVTTVICGPTCTAYDRLKKQLFPRDIQVGDRIVWFNAGAYHLSWETRFSKGLARVIWCDERGRLTSVRQEETPRMWWDTWR